MDRIFLVSYTAKSGRRWDVYVPATKLQAFLKRLTDLGDTLNSIS